MVWRCDGNLDRYLGGYLMWTVGHNNAKTRMDDKDLSLRLKYAGSSSFSPSCHSILLGW
jgi:hypothetical protein